ncbi:flagellar basal body rod protein FlgG [Neoasaia chiangmaiensis NBRC 101099]|uniref:Flagellar basal-body rod protein FlgG n=1 Tax=Neoasaia chiangmaiensis TaxID=320497 RepID=A0A1U9KRF0_9PROT|nr:flagellar basal-body rod protein FlgG [Neoasaia chiangmaiensis]AQS88319.1 flagellar basal-body rod protein FlgG [Neoasaia chiangmaiensis]GBR39554.1 flagellar basal body rod protein FlgG [Neoasaia chiangmaiensis NBRC 101099]GEN14637.1 flagellar basal-body rod protein FlgG [Neoasaia chiangmaiensis]
MRSLDIAGTGMQAQQTNVETISNNIANMTTTGYKRSRAEFQDLIYQNMRRVGTTSSDTGTIVPAGAQVGLGVKTAAIYRINEQGNLEQTSNSLDFAIQGKGYFQVTLPSGQTAYTRDGTLSLANDGTIVTADGYALNPPINVPNNAQSVSVDQSGQISVTVAGQTQPQIVGQMQIATFANENGLSAMGQNLFVQTEASGDPIVGTPNTTGFGSVMQGYVESSNVNVVTEITDLISAQRAYEMNSKVITASDDMMQTLTNLGR